MGADSSYIVLKCRTWIALTSIKDVVLHWELLCNLRQTADVIGMVVANKNVVDVRDAESLEIGNRFVAIVPNTSIKQDHRAVWRNQNGAVSLAYVNEMDLQLAVCLAKGCGSREQYRHEETERSFEHLTSWEGRVAV